MGYLSWKAKTKHFVKRKECFYPPIDDPKIAYFFHLHIGLTMIYVANVAVTISSKKKNYAAYF